MQINPVKAVAGLLLALGISSSGATDNLSRIGYAYDRDSRELLYVENHHEIYVDDKLFHAWVIYKDTDEQTFATKTVDFSGNRFMPEFSLVNNRTGHQEQTRYLQKGYEVGFAQAHTDTLETALLDNAVDGISDAGFDNFIIDHWQEIINGRRFQRYFLVPSMKRFIKFRIYQEAIQEQGDRSFRIIRIEPSNFLVRAIAGTNRLYYDSHRPVLRKFKGVSNLRNQAGKNYRVIIDYDYVQLPGTGA